MTEPGDLEPTSLCCQCPFFISVQRCLLLRMNGIAEELNKLGDKTEKANKEVNHQGLFLPQRPLWLAV